MPGTESLGRVLLILGGVLAFLGVVLLLIGRLPYPSTGSGHRLGKLPGDLTLQREGLTISFPIATWLLLSLALTLLLNLALWVFHR